MSDPRRYLDDDNAAPLAQTLLGSASDDGLDGGRLAAIGRALELDTAASSADRCPDVEPHARVPAAPAIATVTAVAAIAVVVSIFGRGADRVQPSPSTATSSIAAAAPRPDHPAPAAVETPPDAVSVDLLPEAPQLPEAPPPPASARVTTNARAGASASPTAADDLAAEVRALERVRTALAEHRIADAREGLAVYERTFPKKLLGNEARVLEIEMLLADGRIAEADARATAFLASSADSPYAARVRSLIARPRRP